MLPALCEAWATALFARRLGAAARFQTRNRGQRGTRKNVAPPCPRRKACAANRKERAMHERSTTRTLDANEAVADVAYRLSEVIAIYPITPASLMGEHADTWSADQRPNLWGAVPEVVEMQSEGGAAGAVHGALQAGALATTFTASQGLLLMLPDLYKIAGELNAFCMHVAARTIATHALSIFGDHSDVMAARSTGMALLASGSAQEAQDLAAIAHATTLVARVPILHFFDGFRTSHEISHVHTLPDAVLQSLVDHAGIAAHRARALDPDHPVLRGTSQNPDTYFQAREAVEPYYTAFPQHLTDMMARFGALTGRHYRPFEYVGHPEAERVIVLMGSAAECADETVAYLSARGERVGALKVRLFRPFSCAHLLAVLPTSTRVLCALDRTKEPGSSGEPLLQELTCAFAEAVARGAWPAMPRFLGGRYGLAGKDFTPAMLMAVFENMSAAAPTLRFSVGIRDDLSGTSLPFDPARDIEPDEVTRAMFYGLGADGTVSANKASIKIIGEETALYAQGYFEYDSRKSGSTTISHLRFGPRPIRSTYRIRRAQFIAVHDASLLERRDVLAAAMPGATVLINTAVPKERVFRSLTQEAQASLLRADCKLFVVDADAVAARAGLDQRINTVMQVCFFALSKVIPLDRALVHLRISIEEAYGKRGAEVVTKNLAALDAALDALQEVPLEAVSPEGRQIRRAVPKGAPSFVERVTRLLLEGHGDDLPVSAFPPDGTWPTGTSQYEKRGFARDIPLWQPERCVECNFCVMICPHAAIQAKLFDPALLAKAPAGFRSMPASFDDAVRGLAYTVQVAPEDCTGCGLCIEVCPAKDHATPPNKALVPAPLSEHRVTEAEGFAFFRALPSAPLDRLPMDKRTAPLHLPLFEFSGACSGCGETPYVRLLTQLFGDRLLVANATGCSSIYGGNLPTTPYAKDAEGRGPAWSNSLFEDNAEFGLGMRLAVDVRVARMRALLAGMAARLPEALVHALLAEGAGPVWISEQRKRVSELLALLSADTSTEAVELRESVHMLVPRSLWTVGGDGWAYDIGYGGLDHVLASQRKVNILVLDTEAYSNTGGQQSKATPFGASAKFATAGKVSQKKDLGLHAMLYGHVYVASVAMQARSAHTVQVFLEAERHPGPSLVIAHCPCIAHGYDLMHSAQEQKRAIDSGMWPLYRFDPARIIEGEPPLQIDAMPEKLDVARYMEEESRFRMVSLRDPAHYAALVQEERVAVHRRHVLYEQLAKLRFPKPEST
jgi:pyruvate-ferredoxin/flavodoxin oxidoreductase